MIDLTTKESQDFIEALRREGYTAVVLLDDEHYVCLKEFAYSCAIIKGRWLDYVGYDDRWCYANQDEAIQGLIDWFTSHPREAEPTGWHRHPDSGRRRPKGDALQEYVNF